MIEVAALVTALASLIQAVKPQPKPKNQALNLTINVLTGPKKDSGSEEVLAALAVGLSALPADKLNEFSSRVKAVGLDATQAADVIEEIDKELESVSGPSEGSTSDDEIKLDRELDALDTNPDTNPANEYQQKIFVAWADLRARVAGSQKRGVAIDQTAIRYLDSTDYGQFLDEIAKLAWFSNETMARIKKLHVKFEQFTRQPPDKKQAVAFVKLCRLVKIPQS